MKTKKTIFKTLIISFFLCQCFIGFAQLEWRFSAHGGAVLPFSGLSTNLDSAFLGNARQWDINISVAPRRLKFIALSLFTSKTIFDQNNADLATNFQNVDIFSANSLTRFEYGVRPSLLYDDSNLRIELQFGLISFNDVKRPSFTSEGTGLTGDYLKITQNGGTQLYSKNVFQNFLDTDFSIYGEYRFNQYVGASIKASYTSFDATIENTIEEGGELTNYTSALNLENFAISAGLTYTFNSHHKKSRHLKKKKRAFEKEMNRVYLPKEQTLFTNITHPSKGIINVAFLNSSTETTSYFSIKNHQTGKDTIVAFPVSEIRKLQPQFKNGTILLKNSDFLKRLGQTGDFVLNDLVIRVIDDQSTFYEGHYIGQDGEKYMVQWLTDPIPFVWVLVVVLAGAAAS